MADFKDHFSAQAPDYARFRPRYPDALFDYLASLAPDRSLAWDCATGSGQAAIPLATRFQRVLATDASAQQLEQAQAADRIEYRVAPAEDSGLPGQCVALITVAQALHWFDLERFYAEVRRVLKPNGVLAAWCYALMAVDPKLDGQIVRFYENVVGPYWPPERRLVESGYAGMLFPFRRIVAPNFSMEIAWTLDELIGYFGTWSATMRYREVVQRDPLPELRAALAPAWGDPKQSKTVRWPLTLYVGR